jgi:thiol-disulfide isomerase/thioredoxin
MNLYEKYQLGLSYHDFLKRYGTEAHQARWQQLHAQVTLTDVQKSLLKSFKRAMPALCLAGAWCGDCVDQCPIFNHFAKATDKIVMRYFDRDAHPDLAAELKICGGARVPVVVFLSEDGHEVCRYGDRTLARYRKLVADQLGPSCPTGVVPPSESLLAAVAQDWLDEFERVQWVLRTSSRLRQLHGD